MSRAVYIDCFGGVSGDMLLGALLDAGLDLDALRAGLAGLPIGPWSLDALRVVQHGVSGTRALVRVAANDQPHRGLDQVVAIVRAGGLPPAVADRACAVFERLASVEAQIHGTSVDRIEFHEVGALDAIVDVVGVVLGLHLLDVDWSRLMCSGLPLGSGWVRAAHGRLPVPAPATLELMRRAGMPPRAAPSEGETGELTTPTGAAVLSVLGRFVAQPPLEPVEQIGYGFGTREPAWPNALRLIVGEQASTDLLRDEVAQIETHLDDATPEELGFAMEHLLAAGALDVAFSPLQMKKNRPGVLVRVLARPVDAARLAADLLSCTSALGARVQTIPRLIARRTERTVETPWGAVRVKVKHLGQRVVVAPEFDDCAAVARWAGVPLAEVYAAARQAAGSG